MLAECAFWIGIENSVLVGRDERLGIKRAMNIVVSDKQKIRGEYLGKANKRSSASLARGV